MSTLFQQAKASGVLFYAALFLLILQVPQRLSVTALSKGHRARKVMSYALRAVRCATLLRAFYKHLRDWLTFTELNRYRSGRVFEYMWPVLFGEPAVQEPIEARQLACGEAAWCA